MFKKKVSVSSIVNKNVNNAAALSYPCHIRHTLSAPEEQELHSRLLPEVTAHLLAFQVCRSDHVIRCMVR